MTLIILSKIGPSNIMPLISKIDRANDKELEGLIKLLENKQLHEYYML